MATPTLLQKARQQKMIYFGAIIAMFTLSLIHREFVVKEQATRLQLREAARGEVELTSSAVRLMLTGSRGLAVTFLWYNAIEKQKRNEWGELELLVKSITKLQPYFITPWLFQSWNISFNVAVESDRPRDKYYYISRGLELLAEGERRNRGTDDTAAIVFPGNPELRHFMGFFYQLKIGNSDERLTMRSLLEMSCIDPRERNPEKFWTTEKGRKAVNMAELAEFARRHPRLIRRLNEQLGYTDPQRVVQFLQDHYDIPNRFKPAAATSQTLIDVSELRDPLSQFPILPPPEANWPDPRTAELTSETIDVFLICRTWYEFSQKPLPPPNPNATGEKETYDKLRYRMPRYMTAELFREYPPRAQIYIAETLDAEGWFDADGWDATAWIDKRRTGDKEYIFGTDSKYHSRHAWRRGYEMFKEYGVKNGIYLSPGKTAELTELAREIPKQLTVNPAAAQNNMAAFREGKFKENFDAYKRLEKSEYLRRLTNFDAFLYQSEGEGDLITVAARKKILTAERKRKREIPTKLMLDLFEEGWSLYTQACFKYPRFAQVESLQEELYETYQRYLRKQQDMEPEQFKKAAIETARSIAWLQPNLADWARVAGTRVMVDHFEKDAQEMQKVVPIRYHTGPLDRIQYYDGPLAKELKAEFLFRWIQGASLAVNQSVAGAVTYPGHEFMLLTRQTPFLEESTPAYWHPIITGNSRRVSLDRLGLSKPMAP